MNTVCKDDGRGMRAGTLWVPLSDRDLARRLTPREDKVGLVTRPPAPGPAEDRGTNRRRMMKKPSECCLSRQHSKIGRRVLCPAST